MLRKWLVLGVPAVALASLMFVAQAASARSWGGFGTGYYGTGFGYAPGYNYYGGYGSPYYGGYNNWYSGYGTTYNPGSYNGWNSYYYPSNYNNTWGNSWYPNTGSYTWNNLGSPNNYWNYYGHEPNYFYSGVNTYNGSNMQPNQTTSFYSADHMMNNPNVPETAALISVRVPPDAKIWFSDHETKEQGHFRQFVTPALEKGVFYYNLRARWNENGRDFDRSQKVLVRPGDRINVDFMRDMISVDEMTPYHFRGQTQSGYESGTDQNLRNDQFNRNNNFNRNNAETVPSNPVPGSTTTTTTPSGTTTTTTPSGSNTPTTTPNR